LSDCHSEFVLYKSSRILYCLACSVSEGSATGSATGDYLLPAHSGIMAARATAPITAADAATFREEGVTTHSL
jgi:hypothetical protein